MELKLNNANSFAVRTEGYDVEGRIYHSVSVSDVSKKNGGKIIIHTRLSADRKKLVFMDDSKLVHYYSKGYMHRRQTIHRSEDNKVVGLILNEVIKHMPGDSRLKVVFAVRTNMENLRLTTMFQNYRNIESKVADIKGNAKSGIVKADFTKLPVTAVEKVLHIFVMIRALHMIFRFHKYPLPSCLARYVPLPRPPNVELLAALIPTTFLRFRPYSYGKEEERFIEIIDEVNQLIYVDKFLIKKQHRAVHEIYTIYGDLEFYSECIWAPNLVREQCWTIVKDLVNYVLGKIHNNYVYEKSSDRKSFIIQPSTQNTTYQITTISGANLGKVEQGSKGVVNLYTENEMEPWQKACLVCFAADLAMHELNVFTPEIPTIPEYSFAKGLPFAVRSVTKS